MLDYDLTRAEQVRRTDLAQKARRMILSHMKVEAEDETSLTLDHRGYRNGTPGYPHYRRRYPSIRRGISNRGWNCTQQTASYISAFGRS